MNEKRSYTVRYGEKEYTFGGKETGTTKSVPIGEHNNKKGESCSGRTGLLQLDVRNSAIRGGTAIGDFQLIEPEEDFTNFLVICTTCRTDVSKK